MRAWRTTPSFVGAYCFGDAASCPCGNGGGAGRGCASSVNANGALLVGVGAPRLANDSFELRGSGMPNTPVLYFQGASQMQGAFGDGLRCVAGAVVRLGTRTNSGGASSYPASGDLPVSVRGGITQAGQQRHYQAWYRNAAAYCTPSTFNLTNGFSAIWQP